MLGLYVHLPFCRVHCTYCPFAISTNIALQDGYVDALEREIEAEGTGEPADSLYLGGGTPSRTSPTNLARTFDALRRAFAVAPDAEVSMEANPEDVDAGSIDLWKSLGVTRLSIGVQAFHDPELAAIGRVHDRDRAIAAVSLAVGSGLRTSLDLILGLPSQTAATFRDSLHTALSLGAGHISLYMLDLEEHTPLQVQVARGRVHIPDDDLVASLYPEAIEAIGRTGLQQYEVSNFARPGEECRHNLRYWRREEYLGFGIAAHSFRGATRYANTRDIRAYVERSPTTRDFTETLGQGEIRRETIFLQLRQASGMCYEEIEQLCGQEGTSWIERGLASGWLRSAGGRIAFTPAGFLQSNDFISQLF